MDNIFRNTHTMPFLLTIVCDEEQMKRVPSDGLSPPIALFLLFFM